MENKTQLQPYKRSFSGSVGAGVGSLLGRGRSYYVLEHFNSSKYHRAGEAQEIIVDQIEIGRDPQCQVRFDSSFNTVSRRHAAIVREGSRWKLVQLSSTNSTFVNGQKVDADWYLQNGDEIQLSVGGPKLGFIIPQGNKATVGSIGLTRRLSLFRQQALAPYKTALTILSVLLALLIIGGVWYAIEKNRETEALIAKQTELTQRADQIEAEKEELKNKVASSDEEAAAIKRDLEQKEQELEDIRTAQEELKNRKPQVIVRQVAATPTPAPKAKAAAVDEDEDEDEAPAPKAKASGAKKIENGADASATGVNTFEDVEAVNPYVYVIILDKLEWQNLREPVKSYKFSTIVGSGFMLNDGRFVTARHVVEPWYYYNRVIEKDLEYGNMLKEINRAVFNNGSLTAHYTIISPTGRRFQFSYDQIIANRSDDKPHTQKKGRRVYTYVEAEASDTHSRLDWAYFRTNERVGLIPDVTLSNSLPQGVTLEIFGYPAGLGAEDVYNLRPQYSTGVVSAPGLDGYGLIVSSNTEGAHIGGPVMYKKDGKYVAVGIVTGGEFSKKVLVPVAEVK
ncbi:MAG: FHA domain-containing protein [Tannerella sp.]|jgi:hypothetical protein|nr:FHA domain-containing protein [Tannerella sp.]